MFTVCTLWNTTVCTFYFLVFLQGWVGGGGKIAKSMARKYFRNMWKVSKGAKMKIEQRLWLLFLLLRVYRGGGGKGFPNFVLQTVGFSCQGWNCGNRFASLSFKCTFYMSTYIFLPIALHCLLCFAPVSLYHFAS